MTRFLHAFWIGVLGTVLLVPLSYGQETGQLAGTITDAETQEPLPGANVAVVGTEYGTSAGPNGTFRMGGLEAGAYEVRVSFVGYQSKTQSVTIRAGETTQLDVALQTSEVAVDELVVTGVSRKAERITESPATVEAIGSAEMEQLPGFSFEEAFSQLKGVTATRTGVTGVGVNARGFNSAFNTSGVVLTDGRRSTLPGNGLPFANMNPIIKEDIERMEVILGPSSALYGPDASNLVVNIITKDPRDHEGTTAVAEGGAGVDNASMYSGRVWHGQAFADGEAGFKVFGEYTGGQDYNFVDTTYTDAGVAIPEEPDHDINHLRGGTAFYWSPMEDADLVASYNVSQNNYVTPNNIGHNQIKDWRVQTGQLRFSSPNFFAQAYGTWSNSGDTYSLNNAALFEAAGLSEDQAKEEARFISESAAYNAEAQYNNSFAGIEFVLGASYELSQPQSNGTFLSDTTESALSFTRYGVSAQVEREFGPLKVVAAGRFDSQENYGEQFSPKAGLVYQSGIGNFRVTYGEAFVAPTPLQQEIFIPSGSLPNGIPIVVRGNADGFTLADGTEIPALEPEKVQTWEIGYKGALTESLYLDVNGYRSFQEDFVAPLQPIGVATQRGDVEQDPELVLTYQNFGEVNPYGVDATVNYEISDRLSLKGTYSFFDASFDEETFDLNDDGAVTPDEISLNSPRHKGSITGTAKNLLDQGIFGNVTVRYVAEYDFISGVHFASDEQEGQRAVIQLPEGGQATFNHNYGPLGGFTTVNLNVGYRILPELSLSVGARNLFDVEQREFAGSPSVGRMITTRLRADF